MQAQKVVILCAFLCALSAYGACVDSAIDARLCVMMCASAEDIDCHRVYRFSDEQGQEHRIKVEYKTKKPDLGEFVVQDRDAQRKLSFLMECGGEPRHPAHTTVTYSDCSKEAKAKVTSWAEENEGLIDVVAPFGALTEQRTRVQWKVPIDMPRGRPSNYGIITAKRNGAHVTQYIFSTSNRHEGAFVHMWVDYDRLCDVKLSCGTEAYGSSAVEDHEEHTYKAGSLIVDFQSALDATDQ